MQWLKDRFFSSNIKPEMIRRGMQVHRTNGHNYVIRFYHQPDLDEEEKTRYEYRKKVDEYYEKQKESDVESNIQMPVFLNMVKTAKPYSTMTLFQGNPHVTGEGEDIVKKDIVCGSLHVLFANQYESEYLSEDGKRIFDWGHDDCEGKQIYAGWYAHFDKPKNGSERRSVTYVRFYDFREEMDKPRAERKICFVDNKDGHPVWTEGQNGQDTDRKNNNDMREEPQNYDEESKKLGARTLKETLDSCVSVFESTYDTWWGALPKDLNPIVVETNNINVGTVVSEPLTKHPALQAFNTRIVRSTNKSPVKRRKSNDSPSFKPNHSSVFSPIKRNTAPSRLHPDLQQQILNMPEVPTHKIETGNDKGDCKKNNRKKRPIADMVNYQMNLKF